MAAITTRIQNLGLKFAAAKTKKLYDSTALPDQGNPMLHSSTYKGIKVSEDLKYLGLILDGRLNIETHFNRLTRVEGSPYCWDSSRISGVRTRRSANFTPKSSNLWLYMGRLSGRAISPRPDTKCSNVSRDR